MQSPPTLGLEIGAKSLDQCGGLQTVTDRRRAPGVSPGMTVRTVWITDVVDQKANGKRGCRLLEVDAEV